MNNKKILALVLAFAMMFSTISTVFADTTATIGADAEALKTIGVLKGDNSEGVTPAYLAKTTTRMQAAIMFLRLKGLEDEAMAFTGTANFADANTMTWADGKAIMAYLKANPQLGWIGADGGKFNPFETITVQQYYKVILEALGYKQTTAEVAGDFDWTDVITFAASKGLTKVASVTNFTNNDLAIATIEGLKANVKDTNTTLAAVMVEAGMINKEAAIAAGLYEENTTTAVVESVAALGNNKVLIQFDSEVAKAFAEREANYNVVVKGTTTALEVKDAVLDGTTQVVLETAAQTAGTTYTVTVGTVAKNFVGIAKDNSVPSIEEVEGTDYNKVVVTFSTPMDLATALDKANYSFNNGVTVENVAWDDDALRDSVEITTSGMNNSGSYKVTVTNVNSIDGVTLKSASETFTAKADRKAPDFKDVKVDTNTRLILSFKEDNDLNKASAEDIENYTITSTRNDSELEVISATLMDKEDVDNDGVKEAVVEITTASQVKGTKYEIEVNNIADDAVLANKMAKAETDTFTGVAVDTDGPELDKASIVAPNVIKVEFSEDSRLDLTSALDVNNYTVDNDIVVEKAEMVDADDADCKAVKLTVSTLGEESRYEVTVANVEDEYGNVMEEDEARMSWKDEYREVATIKSVKVNDNDEVVVEFTKELDPASAEELINYSFDGGIGTPRAAEYDNDNLTVTLTTKEMDGNKTYKLTVNGVKDIAGRILTNLKTNVVVPSDDFDTTAPEIEDIEAVNSSVIRVTFDEAMDVDATTPMYLYIDSDKTATAGAAEFKAIYTASADDDNTVLDFALIDDANTNNVLDKDETIAFPGEEAEYFVVASTVTDLAGNLCEDNDYAFDSSDEEMEEVLLEYTDQLSVRKFEIRYDEEVRFINDVTSVRINKGSGVPYSVTLTIDEDDDDNNTIVYLESDIAMDEDKSFDIDLNDYIMGVNGAAVENPSEDDLTTNGEDDEEPYVDDVKAESTTSVVVTFSEDVDKTSAERKSNYDIVNADNDDSVGIASAKVDSTDKNVVTLTLTSALESDEVYTLTVEGVEDLAGNEIDSVEFDFDGTDVVAVMNHITGVKVYNGTKFSVYTLDDVAAGKVASVVYDTNKNYELTDASKTTAVKDDEFAFFGKTDTIALGETTVTVPLNVLLANKTYRVTLDGMSFSFKGLVEDGDIDVTTIEDGIEVNYDGLEEGNIVVLIQDGDAKAVKAVGANDESVAFTAAELAAAGIDTAEAANIAVMNANQNLLYFMTDASLAE